MSIPARTLSAQPPLGRHASSTATPDIDSSLAPGEDDETAIRALMHGLDGMRREMTYVGVRDGEIEHDYTF